MKTSSMFVPALSGTGIGICMLGIQWLTPAFQFIGLQDHVLYFLFAGAMVMLATVFRVKSRKETSIHALFVAVALTIIGLTNYIFPEASPIFPTAPIDAAIEIKQFEQTSNMATVTISKERTDSQVQLIVELCAGLQGNKRRMTLLGSGVVGLQEGETKFERPVAGLFDVVNVKVLGEDKAYTIRQEWDLLNKTAYSAKETLEGLRDCHE